MSKPDFPKLLLSTEREMLTHVRAAIQSAADRAAMAIEVSPRASFPALGRMVQEVETGVTAAFEHSTQRTRRKALAALLLLAGTSAFATPPSGPPDPLRVMIAAKGIASAVGGAAVFYARKATPSAIRALPRVVAPRFERTVATENAWAFNDELRLQASVMGPGLRLEYEWDSINDRRRCRVCAALDGERVGPGEKFSGGMWPPAHPLCRCVATPLVLRIPVTAAMAA